MSNPNPVRRDNISKLNKITVEDKDKKLAKEIMEFNLMLFNKYKGKANTPEEMEQRFSEYFQLCFEHSQIPTVEGLAMISGYSRSSFYEINKGTFSPQFMDVTKKAKDYISFVDSQLATKGKIPAPVYIFRSKNYYGMKDTQDIQVTPNQNSQIPENAEEIIDKLPERNSASEVPMLESGE